MKQLSNNKDGEEIDGLDSFPLSQEDKWKKQTTRKRKSKYFNSPPPTKRHLVESAISSSQKHPKTMSHIKSASATTKKTGMVSILGRRGVDRAANSVDNKYIYSGQPPVYASSVY